MEKKRLELHEIFCEILGSRNVYFQPPESVKLEYPAIVYKRKKIDQYYANNKTYIYEPGYEATLIDPNPDSEYIEKILQLPYCSFDRHFTADNLNHDVFTIYKI